MRSPNTAYATIDTTSMTDIFILIPGRTSKQGTTLNEGKYTEGYQTEINTLKMNPDDMERLDIAEGEEVRMWNDHGSVVVPCCTGKNELPPGLLFISYGDKSSQLMPGETHGTGMPDSKGLDVQIEKIAT
jgi:formylmethanofuran dehydrogenase subunit D